MHSVAQVEYVRHQSIDPTHLDDKTMERFWNKVEKDPEGCWEWTACLSTTGYGKFSLSVQGSADTVYAHRLAWVYAHGRDLEPGQEVKHTCGNRACVHPRHLYVR